MIKEIFFQSSLPRSGSTLLQNIIGQNPDFYVTPTSGVLELLYAARHNYSNSPEFKAQDKEIMRLGFSNFCKGGLFSFYEGITDKKYVVDKSRGWGVHYGFLNSFYPNPKIICMVRDLRGVYASMENNFRKNQHLDSGIVNHANMVGTTTEKRIELWSNGQPIGLAIERLGQIFKEGINKNILFIRYEDLCMNPQKEMDRVYEYLNLPKYNHNFNDIKQLTVEDDSVYGIYGDHKIKQIITTSDIDYNQILGQNVTNWIRQKYDWFYREFNY
jgi:sulfotransferase